MMFVYILKCKDDTLYTGYTTDLNRRLKEHNSKIGSKYTRSRTPVKLMYFETFKTKSQAMKREIEIKKFSRKEKFAIISKFDKRNLLEYKVGD